MAAAVDGGQRRTNQVVACWIMRSGARTTDAEPLVAVAAATARVPTTLAAVKPCDQHEVEFPWPQLLLQFAYG